MSSENLVKASLAHDIRRLDELERQRREAMLLIDIGLRALAKERGCAFIRLESFRQEIQ